MKWLTFYGWHLKKIFFKEKFYNLINSLWPSDAIWRQRSGSRLAQVMACCLTPHAITWTNVDRSSVKSSDIHIRAISQEMPQPSIIKISLKITYLKFHSNFPWAKELIFHWSLFLKAWINHHWFRYYCLGTCLVPSHYLNQWQPRCMMPYGITRQK